MTVAPRSSEILVGNKQATASGRKKQHAQTGKEHASHSAELSFTPLCDVSGNCGAHNRSAGALRSARPWGPPYGLQDVKRSHRIRRWPHQLWPPLVCRLAQTPNRARQT